MTFTYQGDRFLLDGKPYRILSGAMHDFLPAAEMRSSYLKPTALKGLSSRLPIPRIWVDSTKKRTAKSLFAVRFHVLSEQIPRSCIFYESML